MKYTIVNKSGWQDDYWRITETFFSITETNEYIDDNISENWQNEFFNMRIQAHEASLSDLTNNDIATFPNGFVAVDKKY